VPSITTRADHVEEIEEFVRSRISATTKIKSPGSIERVALGSRAPIGITRRSPGPPAHHRLAAQTALDQRSRSMIVALLGDRPGRVSPIGYGS
jgi:hypothetical protein